MLAQGESMEKIKPIVVVASKAISKAEKHYTHIGLKALGIDFALKRFQNCIISALNKVIVVTDHQSLCFIFKRKKKGLIKSERIELRHQDIAFDMNSM